MHLAGMAVGSFAVGRTANPGRGLGFRALSDCSFAVMATGYHHLQAFPLVLLLPRKALELTDTGGSEAAGSGAALAADKRCFVLMHV